MILCFIAIVPEPEIASEVQAFQNFALEHFKTGKALRAPPHITLEPPIELELVKLPALENRLKAFAEKQKSFPIQLKNFSAFPPRVIFIDVVKNQKLHQLQNDLKICIRSAFDFELRSNRPDQHFHPHMTVAFRDLTGKQFHKAWKYFGNIEYQRTFVANSLCLLQHNGNIWEERKHFGIG